MLRWKLRAYLDRHNLSAYALTRVADVAPNTVYALARGESERISLEVFDKVLAGLEQLTGQSVGVADLLERAVNGPEVNDLEAQTRGWHDADLSRLGEYEPCDWGDSDPETVGEPLRLGDR